jgi:acetyl/propionyl-CoA carboxylase alpha subunit
MSASVTRGAAAGELIVEIDGRVERVYAVAAGGVTWVFHDGAIFRLEEAAARRGAHHTHGTLSSPMPATVISVNVQPGQEVSAGETLIVLEAMKMELPIRAPGEGRVAAVHCKAGDLVQPDVSLIDFA